jgi:hypothetical protein
MLLVRQKKYVQWLANLNAEAKVIVVAAMQPN